MPDWMSEEELIAAGYNIGRSASSKHLSVTDSRAETPACWIIEFVYYNFGHMIKLSANIHDLSANLTKNVCKSRS